MDEMKILIREEQQDDQREVYLVNKLAFGRENEARLVDVLRNGRSFVPGLSIVAVKGKEVVGHILFTRVSIKINNGGGKEHLSLSLAPMAVRPGFQNQGIGSRLVRYGLEKASKMGFASVVVLGHREYYPRFGFIAAATFGLEPPFEVPRGVFMAVELRKDGLKGAGGIVQYPVEFENV